MIRNQPLEVIFRTGKTRSTADLAVNKLYSNLKDRKGYVFGIIVQDETYSYCAAIKFKDTNRSMTHFLIRASM